jgi:hypothetical protein
MREKSNELKTALALLMEGNVQIKNQVADTLKNKFDPKLLGKIETFQNKLIRADQLLVLLRYDLAYVDSPAAQNKKKSILILPHYERMCWPQKRSSVI